jgi:hypothetical protein
MIARCQKRRRTRIANSGRVFNEQAIWGNPNGLLVLFGVFLVIARSEANQAIHSSLGALD